jgi:tRNA(adenine34) deaminase
VDADAMFRAALLPRAPFAAAASVRRALRAPRPTPPGAAPTTARASTSAPDATADADETFMRLALAEAAKAAANQEVPVGAVLVRTATGEVLAAHHNTVLLEEDPTAHAELKCIREGARALGGWRHLADSTLYVTLEPCPMCAGGILNARLGAVVWGAPNPLIGADGSWINLMGDGGVAACSVEGVCGDAGDGGDIPGDIPGDARASGVDDASVDRSAGASLTPGPIRPHAFKPELTVRRRVLEDECAASMRSFFRARRDANKAARDAARNAARETADA